MRTLLLIILSTTLLACGDYSTSSSRSGVELSDVVRALPSSGCFKNGTVYFSGEEVSLSDGSILELDFLDGWEGNDILHRKIESSGKGSYSDGENSHEFDFKVVFISQTNRSDFKKVGYTEVSSEGTVPPWHATWWYYNKKAGLDSSGNIWNKNYQSVTWSPCGGGN